jgi:hypothetical protein
MSDDSMTLDFSGVKAAKGFDVLPGGWYNVVVSEWQADEVGPTAKKMDPGTPGTVYVLTVDDGPYENRKQWARFWHARSSLPYWKAFLEATQAFTADELAGLNLNTDEGLNEVRERPQQAQLQIKVKVRKQKGYDDSNQIVDYAPSGSNQVRSEAASSGEDTSFLP